MPLSGVPCRIPFVCVCGERAQLIHYGKQCVLLRPNGQPHSSSLTLSPHTKAEKWTHLVFRTICQRKNFQGLCCQARMINCICREKFIHVWTKAERIIHRMCPEMKPSILRNSIILHCKRLEVIKRAEFHYVIRRIPYLFH